MFGSDSAFNVDDKPASTSTGTDTNTNTEASKENASVTGSTFTTGYLFLTGGIGLILGAVICALIFVAMKSKKKKTESESE